MKADPDETRSNARGGSAQRPRALRLIVGYKLLRGAVSLSLALLLVWFETTGRGPALRDLAETARLHAVGALSTRLADLAITSSAEPYLKRIALALLLDGAVTLLEGWALSRGAAWGTLVVTLSMSAFVPFEVVALAHHFTAPRLALFLFNLGIVAYLLSRFRAERRAHARARRD